MKPSSVLKELDSLIRDSMKLSRDSMNLARKLRLFKSKWQKQCQKSKPEL